MADKRKSLSKHPYQHSRSMRSTPNLFSPYLLCPELILPSPISVVQTMPVYSISRSCSSLNTASPFITRSFIASFDSSLAPSNFGSLHTESGVVEDLLIKSKTESAFSSQMDWCGPRGSSTSYTAPVHSDPIIPTSRNPHSDIQIFYQDFRLPNYSLDTFSGRLFDVVSSTTFITSDVQIIPSLG